VIGRSRGLSLGVICCGVIHWRDVDRVRRPGGRAFRRSLQDVAASCAGARSLTRARMRSWGEVQFCRPRVVPRHEHSNADDFVLIRPHGFLDAVWKYWPSRPVGCVLTGPKLLWQWLSHYQITFGVAQSSLARDAQEVPPTVVFLEMWENKPSTPHSVSQLKDLLESCDDGSLRN